MLNIPCSARTAAVSQAEISVVLLRDATGAPSGFIGIIRDTTEHVRALDAEKRLIKLREEFIASVSNDLRNPLFSAAIRNR